MLATAHLAGAAAAGELVAAVRDVPRDVLSHQTLGLGLQHLPHGGAQRVLAAPHRPVMAATQPFVLVLTGGDMFAAVTRSSEVTARLKASGTRMLRRCGTCSVNTSDAELRSLSMCSVRVMTRIQLVHMCGGMGGAHSSWA